jgi:5'-nucleotidase/UDP-sugar diphosphatase
LDAGDLFFKKFSVNNPENESERLKEKARLISKAFALMGYHAIGIGDDDLSFGKTFLLELSKVSNVPFLSSNLIDEESAEPLFQRYIIREVHGLKIGIFSLLSPDVFSGLSDPRKKGLIFQDPVETAQKMVRELAPQTDLVILLSHLGYPKDLELAQKISGIQVIVGGHSGVHLVNAPVIKNTIVLQTSSKGMYAGRVDLTLLNNKASFYNIMTKRSLENNISKLQLQLASARATDAERDQWQRAKESNERALQQLEGNNFFTNILSPLAHPVVDRADIKEIVNAYKSKFPEKK